jgi:hypothetical protein
MILQWIYIQDHLKADNKPLPKRHKTNRCPGFNRKNLQLGEVSEHGIVLKKVNPEVRVTGTKSQ